MERIKEVMQGIIDKLNEWSNEYYVLDSPSVSDKEYDDLFNELVKLEEETGLILSSSPTQNVGGDTVDFLRKVKHTIPMLSSDKSTDIKDVEKFIGNQNVVGSYKLDGSTVVLKYENGKMVQALTRGSGIMGEDITHTAKMIKNLPLTIPYIGTLELRGEALIPWEYYNEMNKDGDLGHPRNVASGGLRQLDANLAADRNIYFYAFTLINWKDIDEIKTKINSLDFLAKMGFDVVPHELIVPDEILSTFLNKFDRSKYENPTDGWVFEYNDLAYGESLGSTGHHDRKLFALKPDIETYDTTFRGIDYKVSRNGMVSLTAMFDPVEIDQTEVSRATVHNVDIFSRYKFGVGDKISVYKANMIIPAIDKNYTQSGTYELIKVCPICGEKLELRKECNTTNLYCPNDICPAKTLAKFTHFVSKHCMDIEGLSEQTLEKFINAGFIATYSDIYHLDRYKDDIIALDGFGEKSYNKLINSIEKSRHTTLDKFINALGIPNIGRSASKTICKAFHGDIDEFLHNVDTYDFASLEDFGEAMSSSLRSWHCEPHDIDGDVINDLIFEKEEEPQMIENDFINGKTFVVTGKFESMPRKDIETIITTRGGKLASSVTKKTAYLLTNDTESGSSKNQKAKELGIPVMTEKEFLERI